ncbi:MAG: methyltransferase domain-containing protein [Nanoarchaeota archaeon]|nr:methyltransferase domain-containing protein [Nanoarchaeota archaeon]MBU4242278.1 methyltransferase domain-containing protein [Nanoarchaeota archaeon]MBU4352607.1 methyltransferase domain-containing protein [Nanoarchaeota archaeon]
MIKNLSKKEIEDINIARKRNEKIKKIHDKNLFMNLDDLRFATNEIVAKYRASRLKCKVLIEIGSGVGFQTFAFAKVCKKVYAVEIDERKIKYAEENAKILKLKNIEFVNDDALKIDLKKADAVFCETARSPESSERSLAELEPNIFKFLEKYGKLTDKICIDVPSQLKKIDLDCEKEYLSVNNELNRLNLFFGSLKKVNKSAVALPGNHRLEETNEKAKNSKALKYLYDIDGAVLKAGLINELAIQTKSFIFTESLLTSLRLVKSPFFKSSFLILNKCKEFDEVIEYLKGIDYGKIILRQKIDPDKYWNERKKYENKLKGNKTCYLFVFKNNFLIAQKL